MLANELRIGNWVKIDGKHYAKIIAISETDFRTENPYNKYLDGTSGDIWFYGSDYIHPAPLTPEILKKAGFEKEIIPAGNDTRTGKPYPEEIKWIMDEINYEDIFKQSWVELKYVHQLQNIFYSLTGKELRLNLTEPVTL